MARRTGLTEVRAHAAPASTKADAALMASVSSTADAGVPCVRELFELLRCVDVFADANVCMPYYVALCHCIDGVQRDTR